ncbi:MBL fold metallo-hydrolase [Rapidithrix thailandica]|uniref:MBL fold metallo-hydrolase n=1 Tax=Rapidithrix thailandica TaxID=413964 RepID=A0AAW9SCY4_9BACT
MSIKVKFYGTRGSIPVCNPEFQTYGGNTTCILLSSPDSDAIGIFDAGTGIRDLGKDLVNAPGALPKDIFLTFSHFHWDHIQGFPFFAPAYIPQQSITLLAMGEKRATTNLKEIFENQMQEAFFPVKLNEMGANFHFTFFQSGSAILGKAHLKAIPHQHPGGAYSYRVDQGNKSVVICTDIEHGPSIDQNIVEFARNADLLIHDAQFTQEELRTKSGWGHSSYEQAIEVARQAGVKQLVMTHHDPDHDDQFLKKIEVQCQKLFPNCLLAKEKMEIEI